MGTQKYGYQPVTQRKCKLVQNSRLDLFESTHNLSENRIQEKRLTRAKVYRYKCFIENVCYHVDQDKDYTTFAHNNCRFGSFR